MILRTTFPFNNMILNSTISDHAVLQREEVISVWGKSHAFSKIQVKLAQHSAQAYSNGDGYFILKLPPMEAGGPHVLTVDNLDVENEKLEIQDLLIGDVWLASGQSNMEWTLAQTQYTTFIEEANPQQIRMLTVPSHADVMPETFIDQGWELCTPEHAKNFSAVATFFGEKLRKETGVPIGILHSSWGGTPIEAWSSRQSLEQNPDIQPILAQLDQDIYGRYQKSGVKTKEQVLPKDPGISDASRAWTQADYDDTEWEIMKQPQCWQFLGYEHSGIFWFRKNIEIPKAWIGKDLQVHLGCIDKQDISFANGEQIGRTGIHFEDEHWNSPRVYSIPAHTNSSPSLQLAVRVNSFIHHGGMSGPEDQMYIFCPSEKDARQNKISIANDWKMKLEHNFGLVEVPNLPFGQDNPNTPAILFENKIAPLLNTAIKGVIWYQGESNADRHRQYKDLLQNMVKDWRYHFKNKDMPFIVVQLANYMADTENLDNSETWPLLREAQNDIMELENTGVAVITDIGEANDIHPLNKKDVGERLAQWALHHTYHLSPLSGSPFLEKAVIHGDKIHLHFTASAGKLKTINDGPIMGLYISCDQKKFVRAHGEIVGHTVIVWHPDITRPCYVRYAWANNPSSANLVNELGYPVSPFRTDRD